MKNFNKKLICCFAILLVFSGGLKGQSTASPEPYFISLIVTDIDKSVEWYQDVLNLELLSRVHHSDRNLKLANLENDNLLIEIIELGSVEISKKRVAGFFKFGLLVDDFDGWLEKLEKLDITLQGDVVNDPNTGKRMVIIKDPDGNRIQLFSK